MNAEVRRAADILRAGGLVAFPTEMVYGLGADASNFQAIQKLYAVKRRPAEHPVIIHFPETEKAFAWAREVPDAATKLAQEHLCRILGTAYGLSWVILRYFNVYGPGQSLSNPYTGILSTFHARATHGKAIEIYED